MTATLRSISVPSGDDFLQEDGEFSDFIAAPELEALAKNLIQRHARFRRILDHELEIRYYWKAAGGVSGGKAIIGKCQKAGGLTQFLAQAHYIIWLAADHLSDPAVDDRTIEAALFHELCHIHVNDDGKYLIRGHDWAGFRAELGEYGLWNNDAKQLAEQLRLL